MSANELSGNDRRVWDINISLYSVTKRLSLKGMSRNTYTPSEVTKAIFSLDSLAMQPDLPETNPVTTGLAHRSQDG